MGAGTTGMDDALGNAFMVKVRDLFTHDEIFQQRRPAGTALQRVLIVRDLYALVGAQGLLGGIGAKFFSRLSSLALVLLRSRVSVPASALFGGAAGFF